MSNTINPQSQIEKSNFIRPNSTQYENLEPVDNEFVKQYLVLSNQVWVLSQFYEAEDELNSEQRLLTHEKDLTINLRNDELILLQNYLHIKNKVVAELNNEDFDVLLKVKELVKNNPLSLEEIDLEELEDIITSREQKEEIEERKQDLYKEIYKWLVSEGEDITQENLRSEIDTITQKKLELLQKIDYQHGDLITLIAKTIEENKKLKEDLLFRQSTAEIMALRIQEELNNANERIQELESRTTIDNNDTLERLRRKINANPVNIKTFTQPQQFTEATKLSDYSEFIALDEENKISKARIDRYIKLIDEFLISLNDEQILETCRELEKQDMSLQKVNLLKNTNLKQVVDYISNKKFPNTARILVLINWLKTGEKIHEDELDNQLIVDFRNNVENFFGLSDSTMLDQIYAEDVIEQIINLLKKESTQAINEKQQSILSWEDILENATTDEIEKYRNAYDLAIKALELEDIYSPTNGFERRAHLKDISSLTVFDIVNILTNEKIIDKEERLKASARVAALIIAYKNNQKINEQQVENIEIIFKRWIRNLKENNCILVENKELVEKYGEILSVELAINPNLTEILSKEIEQLEKVTNSNENSGESIKYSFSSLPDKIPTNEKDLEIFLTSLIEEVITKLDIEDIQDKFDLTKAAKSTLVGTISNPTRADIIAREKLQIDAPVNESVILDVQKVVLINLIGHYEKKGGFDTKKVKKLTTILNKIVEKLYSVKK